MSTHQSTQPEAGSPAAIHHITDAASGLDAFLVLYDLSLGPAFGGIRFRSYPDAAAAREDAVGLARQMAWKCALAGLDAGGGKAVVRADRLIDRAAACGVLGDFIQGLGGQFRTAGDLGATPDDVRAIQSRTGYIVAPEILEGLADSVAVGLLAAIEALGPRIGSEDLNGLAVAVQGVGDIGLSLVRRLVNRGARPVVADTSREAVGRALELPGVSLVSPDQVLDTSAPVLSPCAVGGVIDREAAGRLRCRAIVGGANRILTGEGTGEELWRRRIWYAPDFLVNSGAVIEGVFLALHSRPAGELEVARIGERVADLM
ncbi:MAG: Glu/Leu/Phe/Val dehydrogenase dimerization domain-containing protein, partial [Planctomycetota bacterium]